MKSNIYGIIYIIKNKVNNKLYIGQTSNNNGFNGRYRVGGGGKGIERVYNHYKYYKDRDDYYNKHLLNSIEKYGFDAFEVDEEFDVAYSKEELDKLEDMYIKIYNTIDNKKGYNNREGGSYGKHSLESRKKMSESQKGREITTEHRQKISEANKGKKRTKETKQKISDSKTGIKNPNYGKHLSDKHRQKLSETNTGKFIGGKHGNAKAVYCYELDQIRLSVMDWERELKLYNTNIVRCCKNPNRSTGGYHFRYATEEEIEEFKNGGENMEEYYGKVISSLEKVILEQMREIEELKKENEELKDKVEKLTRENVGLTRELENNRSDNF